MYWDRGVTIILRNLLGQGGYNNIAEFTGTGGFTTILRNVLGQGGSNNIAECTGTGGLQYCVIY
jgi:hypothetical protein